MFLSIVHFQAISAVDCNELNEEEFIKGHGEESRTKTDKFSIFSHNSQTRRSVEIGRWPHHRKPQALPQPCLQQELHEAGEKLQDCPAGSNGECFTRPFLHC